MAALDNGRGAPGRVSRVSAAPTCRYAGRDFTEDEIALSCIPDKSSSAGHFFPDCSAHGLLGNWFNVSDEPGAFLSR